MRHLVRGRCEKLTPTKYCGLSKGDIHEKPATIIHHGGDIAAWCWRRFGARHEERRGARARSGGTAECPGGKGGAGLEIRVKQSSRDERANRRARIRKENSENPKDGQRRSCGPRGQGFIRCR